MSFVLSPGSQSDLNSYSLQIAWRGSSVALVLLILGCIHPSNPSAGWLHRVHTNNREHRNNVLTGNFKDKS